MGSHCSDLQELIGGQPWILVRMPAKADASADEAKLSGVDKVRNQAACVAPGLSAASNGYCATTR